MGNAKSKSDNAETINEINQIAADYILENPEMDFLLKPKYCSELNILTQKAFDKNFTLSEVEVFGQGIKAKEKIYSISRSAWNKERIEDPARKAHMCKQLSEFYVKIAHVFAAIVDTIKPVASSDNPSYKNLLSYNLQKFREIPNANFCLNRLNNLESAINGNDKADKPADKTVCKELTDKYKYPLKQWDNEIGTKTYTDLFKWEDPNTKQNLFENSIQLFSENLTGKKSNCSNRTKQYKENKNKATDYKKDILYNDYCSTRLCREFNETLQYTCIDKTKLGIKYKQHIGQMRKRYHQNLEKLYSFIKDIFEKQNNKWIIKSSLTEDKLDKMIPKVRETIAKCYFDCNNDYIKGLKIYTSVYEYYFIKKKSLIDCTQLPSPSNDVSSLVPKPPAPIIVDNNLPTNVNLPGSEINKTNVDPRRHQERREQERRHQERREQERRHQERRDPTRNHDPEYKREQEEKIKKEQEMMDDYKAKQLIKAQEEREKKKANEGRLTGRNQHEGYYPGRYYPG